MFQKMENSKSTSVGSHLLLPIPFQPLLLREYADILQQQFNKRFTFPKCEPPSSISTYSTKYWKDQRLQSMKDRLNQTKSQLNNLPLEKWHKHTRSLDPAGKVIPFLKKDTSTSICWLT